MTMCCRATLTIVLTGAVLLPSPAAAAVPVLGNSDAVQIGVILTVMAVAPAIVICMTSFIRIIIVLSMVRHAFGMPETPPNAVLMALALFLTAFSMGPTLAEANSAALTPYVEGRINVQQMLDRGGAPLRDFMLAQTSEADIVTIYEISAAPMPATRDAVDTFKLVPAFMINELRVAFTIGFVILLPFLLIDIVVSALLLALGMMMVPPSTISLPIKLLMFVLIDGWGMIIRGVLGSFQ
jgi:flagellar biosynthesis protein FliP